MRGLYWKPSRVREGGELEEVLMALDVLGEEHEWPPASNVARSSTASFVAWIA
jgi:hypothetical protein